METGCGSREIIGKYTLSGDFDAVANAYCLAVPYLFTFFFAETGVGEILQV